MGKGVELSLWHGDSAEMMLAGRGGGAPLEWGSGVVVQGNVVAFGLGMSSMFSSGVLRSGCISGGVEVAGLTGAVLVVDAAERLTVFGSSLLPSCPCDVGLGDGDKGVWGTEENLPRRVLILWS